MNISEFVVAAINHGFVCEGCEVRKGSLTFIFSGFSKSGQAHLYQENESYLTCMTRYGQEDRIYELQDLVDVYNQWVRNYWDRSPFEGCEIMEDVI